MNKKPEVENQKLNNIVNDLYKGQDNPNHVGNGTTMDAVRNEIITGEPTFGRWHTQKLTDSLNGLNNLLNSGNLSAKDTDIVKALIEEILNALKGK